MSEERGQTLVADGTPEGVYVYCSIESGDATTLGNIGIGGRGDEVFTVHHRDLAAVVGRAPLLVYDPTRENALTHERVQEIVTHDHRFTPVPMSLGTLFRAFGAGLLERRPLAARLVRPLPESEEPSRKRCKPLRSPKATTK